MGVFQDETFSDALKLAFAARVLSPLMPSTFPSQAPVIFLSPPTYHDLMNPTTMNPFTISNPYLSTPSSTKTLRPSYVAIPLYTIIPLHSFQPQAPPPHPTPSPHLPDSAFWNVVERTVEHSVHGAAALVRLLSEIAKASSEKNQAPLQDEQQLPSCDSFDLSSLPSIPAEDDLLRLDLTELESIPSSELYLGEAKPAAPKPSLSKRRSPPLPRSSSSNTSLDTLLGGYLPGEDLSLLLQIPDDELYFDLEHLGELGTAPPWPFNSSAITTPSTLSST